MASKKDKKLAEDLLILKRVLALRDVVEKFVTEYNPERDTNEVAVRLETLNKINKEFHHVLSEIEQIDAAEKFDQHIAERTDFENRFCRLKGFLLSKQKSRQPLLNSTMSSTFAPSHNSTSFHHRLPKIDLPKFFGDESRWISFRDSFVSMIHSNDDIPTVNKLQYLLQSLEGDAKKPFESVDIQANNYASTWDALMKRYDNKRFLRKELFRGLFDLPTIERESALELNTLVDDFQRHVKALGKLGEPIEHWDTPLTFILCNKLDATTLRSWEHETRRQDDVKYDELIEFLIQQVRMLKSVSSDLQQRSQAASAKVAGPNQKTVTTFKSVVNAAVAEIKPNTPQCYACSQMHPLHQCPTFIKLSESQRRELVTQRSLCWNCFRPNHNANLCKSKFSCRTCQARHHTMLHDQAAQPQVTQASDIQASPIVTSNPSTQQPTPSTPVSVGPASPPEVNLSVQSKQSTVLLETVALTIVDKHGTEMPIRALLDSAAMSNLISERLANHLATRQAIVDVAVVGIGDSVKQIKHQTSAVIKSRTHPFSTTLEFLVIKKPTANLPTTPIDVSTWNIPNYPLADPFFNVPGMVDIIIGGECYHEIHTGQRKLIGDGLPYVVETLFGWTVSGKVANTYATVPPACYLFTVDQHQEPAVEQFELELVDHAQAHSAEEKLCETLYANTATRTHSGRYTVCLPRSEDPQVTLGNSQSIATRRFYDMERRLEKDSTTKPHQFTEEHLRSDYLEKPHRLTVEVVSTITNVHVLDDRPSSADNVSSTIYKRTQAFIIHKSDEILGELASFPQKETNLSKPEAVADVPPENPAIQLFQNLQDNHKLNTEEHSRSLVPGTENSTDEASCGVPTTETHQLPSSGTTVRGRLKLTQSPNQWPPSDVPDTESPATGEETFANIFRCFNALRAVAHHTTEETLNSAPFVTTAHRAQQQLFPDDFTDPSRCTVHHTPPLACLKRSLGVQRPLTRRSTADLPNFRVTPPCPFFISDVDYCVPVNLKSSVRKRPPNNAFVTVPAQWPRGHIALPDGIPRVVSLKPIAADNVIQPATKRAILILQTKRDNDHQRAETTKIGRAVRNSLDAYLDSYQIVTTTSSFMSNLSSLRRSGQIASEWSIQAESHR